MSHLQAPTMTLDEANRLVDLSRQARWDFPSSQGRPVKWDLEEEWVDRLVREQSSFGEAAKLLIENGGEDLAMEMASNVWRLWRLARDTPGGRRFLGFVLDAGSNKPSRFRALSLYGDGLFAFLQGKIEESRKRNDEALKVAREVYDSETQALSHLGLSRVSFETGNYAAALTHATEARKFASNVSPALSQAPLFMHAQSLRMLGQYDEAASLFRHSVDLNRRIQDKGMVVAELTNLAFVEVHLGNADAAEHDFLESEKLAGALSDPYSKAMTYLTKSMVALLKQNRSDARTFLTQFEKTLKDAGLELGPDDKSEYEWITKKLAET